jgi:hypothetical protein
MPATTEMSDRNSLPTMPFLAHRYLGWIRRCTVAGGLLATIGLAGAKSASGVAFLLVGLGLLVAAIAVRVHFAHSRQSDRAAAKELAEALRHGDKPPAVSPAALTAWGYQLEPGESCYLDGVPAECLSWYGDPVLIHRRVVLAWGGPLAWGISIFGTLFFWRRNRKKAKAAAPRWRDPESLRLWMTDRRFILHGETGRKSWVQIRWESINDLGVEGDGLVIVLADAADLMPMKVRFGCAAWAQVWADHAASTQIMRSVAV